MSINQRVIDSDQIMLVLISGFGILVFTMKDVLFEM